MPQPARYERRHEQGVGVPGEDARLGPLPPAHEQCMAAKHGPAAHLHGGQCQRGEPEQGYAGEQQPGEHRGAGRSHARGPPLSPLSGMARARQAILAHGGAAKANVFTRTTLALFGQVPWRAVPVMPVVDT
jgi:hypothetical protein